MAKKMIFQKFVEENLIGVDKITRHKDGTFSLKRSFFYRHGMDTNKFYEIISKQLTELGVEFIVEETFEDWKPWPKTSYFVVRISVQKY